MKRSLPSMIAGIVLVAILGLYMVTYQVRSTQVAVVKTFDKATPNSVVREPGLKWKWPWPIQKVDFYDNRVQTTTIPGEETSTADKNTVIVSTTVSWRIDLDKPFEFSKNYRDMKAAEENLRSRVRNDQKTVLGSHAFSNLVSKRSEDLEFDKIEQELLATVKPAAKELYFIDVTSIRIDKLSLPASVTEKVFDAMRKERQAQADQYTSEGNSEAERIKKEAESIAKTILSFADLKAAQIVTEGQAAAVAANKTFSKDEQLRIFLLKLERLGNLLEKNSTIILNAEQQPFDLIPETPPAKQAGPAGATTRPAEASRLSAVLPEIVEPR